MKIFNISLVYFKGTVQREFSSFFTYMVRPRSEQEPILVLHFSEFLNIRPRPIHICQKTKLKSRWTVPLNISYTITWLAIVQ
jgi:hypothetical protein